MSYETRILYSEDLKREVTLYIYLPESYHHSNQTYPVLYMQDGHNLFDDETATFGTSWGIIETYEKEFLPEVIIVGIGADETLNGMKRIDEYSPWRKAIEYDLFTRPVGGLGDVYLKFVVDQVKPFIEEVYRVNTDSSLTGIGGSSMGALIATIAALRYPSEFGRILSVSPSYWFALDELLEEFGTSRLDHLTRFYLDSGTAEGSDSSYLDATGQVYQLLLTKGVDLYFQLFEGAMHNEEAWGKRFDGMIKYLYNDLME